MKIVLCDDDSRFLQREEELVRAYFDKCNVPVTLVKVGNGEALLALEPDFDVLFLDMQLLCMNGIDVAEKLRLRNRGFILVIVSDSIQYAPQGYAVNAFRYVLKSDLQRLFLPCLQDVHSQLCQNSAVVSFDFVDWDGALPVQDIIYIESQGHKTVFCLHGRAHTCYAYESLAAVERALEGQPFVRTHKSYLVNLRHVQAVTHKAVTLKGGGQLPVGRSHTARVKQAYILYRSGAYV